MVTSWNWSLGCCFISSNHQIWCVQLYRVYLPLMMTSSNGNIFFALLILCAGNSLDTGEFPSQRPVTRSFDVFFSAPNSTVEWIIVRLLIWDASVPVTHITVMCLVYFCDSFTHILRGCFMNAGTAIKLPNTNEVCLKDKIGRYVNTVKHDQARTACLFVF